MTTLVWTVTNVLSALILPPASLLILIAAGLWFSRERPWGRWLAGGALLVLGLLCVPAVGLLLVKPFEMFYPPLDLQALKDRPKERFMVLVLGGGRDLGAIEYPEKERLSDASLRRARYAARLAGNLDLPLAVSGGRPTGGVYSEAALMKSFIETELKRPVALVEDQSLDTRQNALFSAQKLRELGILEVMLVTDVTHMPRAVRAFGAAGLSVIPAPLHFQSERPFNVGDFLPSDNGLVNSRHTLRELLGELWYRVRPA